jgi:hypothetical protein
LEPAEEPVGDRVQRVWGAQVRAGRGDLRDTHGHVGVVAPLAGGEMSEAAAEHLGAAFEGPAAVLVGDAEGVADSGAEEGTDGAVGLDRGKAHQALTSSWRGFHAAV